MTIKRRLFLSNVLMIVVPALVTALTGLLCMVMVVSVLRQGSGLGYEEGGELAWIGRTCREVLQEAPADSGSREIRQIVSLLDGSAMRLVLTEDGRPVYTFGTEQADDARLMQSAESLDCDPVQVSTGSRGIYLTRLTYQGRTMQLALFGTPGEHTGEEVKAAVALSALLILLAIVLSILATNRFLTRFVLRRVEEPLDLLAAGVRRIGEGDLDFRIAYAGKDEFAPVCGAFNEMAARLKESVERTRRDEESRKELLAGISHDLRSPLTSIRAYVEGLLDGVAQTEESKQRYLRTIRTKAEDIDRLVSQLFLYSKLDLEGVPMEMRPIRLDEFVAGFVEEAALDGRTRGLEITAEQLIPVTVSADPEQLRRVLSNILENSIKYKAKETGRLRITLEESGRLTLADDGPGVPEEALPKLFDVFTAATRPGKTPPGAAAWDWPSPPRRCRAWAGPSGPAAAHTGDWPLRSHFQRRKPAMQKILIVEDDGDIAAIERDYLELNNYQVEIAADGLAGLERGLHGDFDLILLDLMLPGMDGFSVCRRLREETDVPILMVTARREDIDKIRGLGLGADDYIEKPFSPSVLVARVRAHLARYQRLTGGQQRAKPELQVGGVRLNTETRRVFVDGREVELKNREYELLCFLMLHLDMVFSREELYERIWGLEAMGDNATVAVHINRIREKIEPDPSRPRYIQTVWGAGYRFKGQ